MPGRAGQRSIAGRGQEECWREGQCQLGINFIIVLLLLHNLYQALQYAIYQTTVWKTRTNRKVAALLCGGREINKRSASAATNVGVKTWSGGDRIPNCSNQLRWIGEKFLGILIGRSHWDVVVQSKMI